MCHTVYGTYDCTVVPSGQDTLVHDLKCFLLLKGLNINELVGFKVFSEVE